MKASLVGPIKNIMNKYTRFFCRHIPTGKWVHLDWQYDDIADSFNYHLNLADSITSASSKDDANIMNKAVKYSIMNEDKDYVQQHFDEFEFLEIKVEYTLP